jgi:hypothetical protein
MHTDTYGYIQYRHIAAIIGYIQIHTDTYRYHAIYRYIHIHQIEDVCRIHAIHTDTYTYITVSAWI